MEAKAIKDTDTLLTRQQAAEFLGCKASTLALWKCTKRYPLPYVKIGKNIRYRLSDLRAFVTQNVQGQ
jgi:predicted DNA-binding transcriptional regulator AlpA